MVFRFLEPSCRCYFLQYAILGREVQDSYQRGYLPVDGKRTHLRTLNWPFRVFEWARPAGSVCTLRFSPVISSSGLVPKGVRYGCSTTSKSRIMVVLALFLETAADIWRLSVSPA